VLTFWHKYRIEIKYTLITLLLLAGLGAINTLGVFDGVERRVNEWMDTLAEWGMLGLFFIGIFANMTLVFIIPYALPLMTLAIYADSVWHVIALGTAAGLGGGIGEVASYAVAHTLVAAVDDLEKSALFRWTNRTIRQHPRVIPVFVWLASATPAPDAVIIVPLAMIQYPWQKMVIPMLTGKVFQNVVMALVYRFASDYAAGLVSDDINFDMTATLTLIFVMLIIYQVEKARANANARDAQPEEEPQATTAG
jgi:membrane protein YqaA with SNARE-associated domain